MPTANVVYLSSSPRIGPESPLPGDPWDVTVVATTGEAIAALERQPDGVFVDADDAELRAGAVRRGVPVVVVGDVMTTALAFERARIDKQLDQLRDLGGDEFVHEMIDLLIGQTPDQLRTMHESLADGDLKGAQRVAHSLKSSAGNFGGRVVQELSFRVERVTDVTGVAELLDQLDAAYGRMQRHLAERRG